MSKNLVAFADANVSASALYVPGLPGFFKERKRKRAGTDPTVCSCSF
jgi:hypothetical protein